MRVYGGFVRVQCLVLVGFVEVVTASFCQDTALACSC